MGLGAHHACPRLPALSCPCQPGSMAAQAGLRCCPVMPHAPLPAAHRNTLVTNVPLGASMSVAMRSDSSTSQAWL